MARKVAIVGGGISGLVTGFYVKKFARERSLEVSVTLYEKDELPGGKMRTYREEGFIVEWGPNGFLTNKPDTLILCEDLSITGRLLPSSDAARKRFVFTGGKLKRLPESALEFFQSSILSKRGRIRVAMEPFIPGRKGDGDESLTNFARRRLGEEATEKLIEPMAAGIYAGDPDKMSLKSCFPLIHELELRYGSLVRGMFARMRERKGSSGGEKGGPAGPGGVLTSFDGGVTTIVEALEGRGDFDVRLGWKIVSLTKPGEGGYSLMCNHKGSRISDNADVVVLASPAYAASEIVGDLDPGISETLGAIPYAPVSVVSIGFEKKGLEEKLNAFGFLVPRGEERKVLGVLYDSCIFSNRAPEGYVLLRGMVGGARNPTYATLDEDELIEMVRKEMEGIIGIDIDPVFIKLFVHERGIPQYLVGHGDRVNGLEESLLKYPGLYLNNNAYRGIGLNDCVKHSREGALRIIEYLDS